jgi:hypothetical protein
MWHMPCVPALNKDMLQLAKVPPVPCFYAGIQDIAQTKAAVDHEGNLQLPGWPIQVNGCSATDSEPPPGTSLTDHTAVMAGRATDTSTSMHLIPLWPVQSSHQVCRSTNHHLYAEPPDAV